MAGLAGVQVGLRLSTTDWVDGGWGPNDSVAFTRRLKRLGGDFIHVSTGGESSRKQIPSTRAARCRWSRSAGDQALLAPPARGMTHLFGAARIGLDPGAFQQVGRGDALHHLQHRRHKHGLRSPWHTPWYRQRQHALPHRHLQDDMVHRVRCRPRLATEGQQLAVTATEEGVQAALDEPGQSRTGAGPSV